MQQAGRPREFHTEEALSTIMQLFWKHGYEATGLSDIMKATGLAKASIYSAFGNKQSMYLKALALYEKQVVDSPVMALRLTEQRPIERIDAFLSSPILAIRDRNDRRGCFLCNASADRASLDDETSMLVRKGYEKLKKAIATVLHEAFPSMPTAEISSQSQLILTVYSGLRIIARSGMSDEHLSMAKNQIMMSVRAIQVPSSRSR